MEDCRVKERVVPPSARPRGATLALTVLGCHVVIHCTDAETYALLSANYGGLRRGSQAAAALRYIVGRQAGSRVFFLRRAGEGPRRAADAGAFLFLFEKDCTLALRTLRSELYEAAQIQRAIEAGLGPLLFSIMQGHPEAMASLPWPLLHGAHVTAQFLSREQLEAIGELLEACARRLPPVTLLKGISICRQHYPAPRLRIIRDIDILVDEAARPAVEALLVRLGYRQRSRSQLPAAFFDTYHHSMPFFHAQRGVWIEVHRGLFPPTSPLGLDPVFSRAHVATQLRPSVWQGHTVMRLSDELQLVYIAAHWAQSFQVIGGLVALVDTIYLLRHTTATLDWERLGAWLHGSVAAPHVYLMLTYLARRQVLEIDPQVLQTLSVRQRAFGTLNLRLLHALVDRYMVSGQPVGHRLSPRKLHLLWESLLSPDPALHNLMRACVKLLVPARWHPRLARLRHLLGPVAGKACCGQRGADP
jgi:hypothetical protein